MATSTSSASGSTVTVADEVWTRPLASVTGTRWTRCGAGLVLQAVPGVLALHEEDRLVEPVACRTRPRRAPRPSSFRWRRSAGTCRRGPGRRGWPPRRPRRRGSPRSRCGRRWGPSAAGASGVRSARATAPASASSSSWRMSSRSSPDASSSISLAVATSLAGRRQLAPGADDLAELLVAARQVAQAVRVGRGGRVGQLGLDGLELGLERGHPVVEHAAQGSSCGSGRGGRPAPAGSVLTRRAGVALVLPLRSP